MLFGLVSSSRGGMGWGEELKPVVEGGAEEEGGRTQKAIVK